MCDENFSEAIIENPKHSSECLSRIFNFYYVEKFCDLEIIGKNQRFPVHLNIMATFSRYFANISNNIRNSKNRIEVNLSNINEDTIKKIIEYCYTGKLTVNNENLLDIIEGAGFMEIDYLLNECETYSQSYIDNKNCILLLKLCKSYSLINLEPIVNEYILFNFSQVCVTDEFLNLHYDELLTLLKNEDLNVTNENVIYDCVKRWINHKTEQRNERIKSLFEWIKLPYLTAVNLLEAQNICRYDPCYDLTMEAIRYNVSTDKKEELESFRTTKRYTGCLVLIVGDWYDKSSAKSMIYDRNTTKWTSFITLTNSELRNFSSVVVKDYLLIIGGFSQDEGSDPFYKKSVKCYDMKTNEKIALPNMNYKRSRPCVAIINDTLYVTGGFDGTTVLDKSERFDFKTQTWTVIRSMPTARQESACVVYENELFVIGGSDGIQSLTTVEAYSPKTCRWRTCQSMLIARAYITAATVNNYIYVVGGLQFTATQVNLQSAERYDPKSNEWTLIAKISVARYGIGLCAFGNNLLAIGGRDGLESFNIVEEYNTSTEKWETLGESPQKRANFSSIAISKPFMKRINANVLKLNQ